MSEERDELRLGTVGSPVVQNTAIVEWNGRKYEVRRPTLKQTQSIQAMSRKKNGEIDDGLALVQGIIHCVYVPGTNERVYEQADVDAIQGRGIEDFIGAFASALGKLGAKPEEIEKNSEGAPTE